MSIEQAAASLSVSVAELIMAATETALNSLDDPDYRRAIQAQIQDARSGPN